MKKTIQVSLKQEGLRLDAFLSSVFCSRSQAEKAIKQGLVHQIRPLRSPQKSDSALPIQKPSMRVKEGECYRVALPADFADSPFKPPVGGWGPALKQRPLDGALKEDSSINVPILFEDNHLLVINKPAGVVMYPGPGHQKGTLVNALLQKTQLSSGTDVLRPGVVHRLDKDVSGLMLVSKTKLAESSLIEGFKLKKIHRVYRALTLGLLKEVDSPIISFIGRHPKNRQKFYSYTKEGIGRKQAITHYKVLGSFKGLVHHIECRLETGRTHQIRLHLKSRGLPILGDKIYLSPSRQKKKLKTLNLQKPVLDNVLAISRHNSPKNRLALYSAKLWFSHPVYHQPLSFQLPWPEEFKPLLNTMEEGGGGVLMRAIIHITTGDINGIGLEVALKALKKIGPLKGVRFVLWRSAEVNNDVFLLLGNQFNRVTLKGDQITHFLSGFADAGGFANTSHFANAGDSRLWDLAGPAEPTKWVVKASRLCLKNPKLSALVTGPLSKVQMEKEGFQERGHTGLLKKLSNAHYVYMSFLGDFFNVTLLTGHLPIKSILWKQEDLKQCITLCLKQSVALSKSAGPLPLGVLGFNPHAGEGGLLGTEEQTMELEIKKWGERVKGPLVPDVAFKPENWPRFFMYLCVYHDQGLIPFKLLHGLKSLQFSMGLPFLRASVSHGTAKDIFGKNKAVPESMHRALLFALKPHSSTPQKTS